MVRFTENRRVLSQIKIKIILVQSAKKCFSESHICEDFRLYRLFNKYFWRESIYSFKSSILFESDS